MKGVSKSVASEISTAVHKALVLYDMNLDGIDAVHLY